MEVLYGICGGVDVHKKILVVCLRSGRKTEIREFGTTTRELLECGEWLQKGGCQMVAMESTGSYWKPLYNVLEAMDMKAIVVNAQHMKAVPGREGCGMDRRLASAWVAESKLHSQAGSAGTAGIGTVQEKPCGR